MSWGRAGTGGGGSLYEVQRIMGNDYMGPDGSERKSYYLLIWSENPGYLIRDSNTLGYLLPLPFHALYALMYKPKTTNFKLHFCEKFGVSLLVHWDVI